MAHITIKNIGAIKEVDLDLNKINVFMGAQSSGKSTIAKIICHCQWIEKRYFADLEKGDTLFQDNNSFYDKMVEYHRLDGYFDKKSYIYYKGEYITLEYHHQDKKISINKEQNTQYKYPKIAYIPSERNLVAAIPNLKKYNETNDTILYFMYDWFSAREALTEISLKDILQHKIEYLYSNDRDYIIDRGKKILITNASSGIQSLTPLIAVLKNSLENVYYKKRPLSYEQKIIIENQLSRLTLSNTSNIRNYEENKQQIESTFDYHLSNIFLEEPEQNLFPNTQLKFMYWLTRKLRRKKHQLTLTTHSPYILFALNNCMMGGLVDIKIPQKKRLGFESSDAWISPQNVSVYEITDGILRCIQDKDGIIENNYLNQAYKEVSDEYLSLLDYYYDKE